ncbi:FtsX-like permease family protein [Diaminobutyricimonas aerilata]|uniref:FtsX-like permease family protein n=2 Tax=Diaminobutyricimonas aerilata TaxID=1162967 RepID=A0A2M9CNM4_9MICO|nr:FtsX-like permease family protein [Diaminobutyricimonas aerilata]
MIWRMTWLLARPTRDSLGVTALPIVAFGIVTALLLAVLGGAQAFWRWDDDMALTYQALAVLALTLLLVPLATLGGSAARLSARRRDDRLSTLRLLGATPAAVGAMTVIESAALALIGAVLGTAASFGLAPIIGAIPFRGEPLGFSNVLLPLPVLLGAIVGVVAIAVVSAVIGLRRVTISPLGVRTRQEAPRMSWVRALVAVAVVALAAIGMSVLGMGGAAVVLLILAAGFGGTIAVLNLVGPWVIGLVARGRARRAQTPQKLLAARAILESPQAAWRQVSGTAMVSFMAVFAGTGTALLDALSASDGDADTRMLATDIGTGLTITVVISFLMVACSVGVNQAAGILDRAELYASLHRLGMPEATADAARRGTVMVPLLITSIGSAVIAAIVVFPLTGIALIVAPLSLLVIAGVLAAGILLVRLGLLATRPLLRRASLATPGAV